MALHHSTDFDCSSSPYCLCFEEMLDWNESLECPADDDDAEDDGLDIVDRSYSMLPWVPT